MYYITKDSDVFSIKENAIIKVFDSLEYTIKYLTDYWIKKLNNQDIRIELYDGDWDPCWVKLPCQIPKTGLGPFKAHELEYEPVDVGLSERVYFIKPKRKIWIGVPFCKNR